MSTENDEEEVVESFSVSLGNLTVESEAQIDLLTQVAEENLGQAGAIVKVVNDQLRKVPHSAKLPILYLIDSIVKNVGEDYIGLFPSVLKQCFADIYEKVDEKTRQSMCQLRQSWGNILSPKSLCHIDMQIQGIDPNWTVKVGLSQLPLNSSPKILINRNFLSSALNFGNAEKDEAEILREQLLAQKKIRELEREQNKANTLCKSELGGIKESPEKQCREKAETASLSSNGKSAKSQADSTTNDGSSAHKGENVSESALVPSDNNDSFCDKRASGQLLNLLSALITKQNNKCKEQLSEKLPLHKYYFKHDKHRRDHRQTRYSEDKLNRSYNCSRSRSYNKYRCRSYDRYRWCTDSIDGNKAAHQCSEKARDHYHKSPIELPKPRSVDEPKSQGSQDCPYSSEICQTPALVHEEDLIHQLPEDVSEIKNDTVCTYPKRKLNFERAEQGPYIKAPCVNSANTTLSSCPSPSVIGGRETQNFKSDMTNCNARVEEISPSHSSVANTSLSLGSAQNCDFSGSRNCDQTTPQLFNSETKAASLTPKPSGQFIEKSLEIQREIHYNHGYGLPEKNYDDGCEQENILCTTPQLSKKPILQSGSHTFPPMKKNPVSTLETSIDFIRNHDLDERLSRYSHKDTVNDPTVYIPAANQFVLEQISKDSMKSILVNGVSREIRFYGWTALVGPGSDDPREVFFKPGEAEIIINDIVVPGAFHKPDIEVVVNCKRFRVRLGAPTRELIVNDEGFQCAFNGPPIEVHLSSGDILCVQLKSSTLPTVEIGAVRRDLVVGQVFLGIDSAHFVRMFLDAKPQSFYVGSVPHILSFADGLRTILVNDQPVQLQFGGPPIALTVNGVKHFVSLSELPSGVVPGQVYIVRMPCVMSESDIMQCNPERKPYLLETPPIPAAEYKKPWKRAFQRNYMKGRANQNKRRSRSSVNFARKLQRMKRWSDNPMSASESRKDNYQISIRNYYAAASPELVHLDKSINPNSDSNCKSNINVHELFQNLCDVGLLKPQSTSEENKSPGEEIYGVDFKDKTSLKWKQPKIIATLYSGIQCSSCGVRFFPCNAASYREHLDLHFQQNHKLKKTENFQSRSWYCGKKAWIQLGDLEVNATGEVEMSSEKVKRVECSVPSKSHPPGSVCEVCREKFEEFFHDDEEEWHLRDCMSSEKVLYHPTCFKDQNSTSSFTVASKPSTIDTHCEGNESLQLDSVSRSVPSSDVDSCQPVVEMLVNSAAEAMQTELAQPMDHSISGLLVAFEEENSLNDQRAKEVVADMCEQSININDNKGLVNDSENFIQEECPGTKSDPLNPCNTNNCCKEEDVDRNIKDVEFRCVSERLETVILKPKLAGRKLVLLPPAMKGSETSNLCCVT